MKMRLGMFLLSVITSFSTVWGGYLWNGGNSAAYSGTANWTEDPALTGKWITSGTITLTDSAVIIGSNANDSQLTVDGATVSTNSGNRIRIGYGGMSGTLTIQNGGSVTSNGCLWMGDGAKQTGTVNISSGGIFHVTSTGGGQKTSFIGNHDDGGNATILVNNGTFSTDKAMHFGHKGDAEMTIVGNGSFESTANFNLGGGANDSLSTKTGKITVGDANSAGHASFANLSIGKIASGILDIQQGTVSAATIENSGQISVRNGELETTGSLQLTSKDTSNERSKLYVGKDGKVTVSSNIITESTEITVEEGGQITASQLEISKFKGVADITVSGAGSLMKIEGNTHSALNSGSLTVTNQATATFKTRLYFGRDFTKDPNSEKEAGQTGTIQVEVSNGGLLQAGGFWFGQHNGNDISVSITSGGTLYDDNLSGQYAVMFVGDGTGSSVVIGIDDGGTLKADGTIHIGQEGKGTIRVSRGGNLTAQAISVGNNSNGKGLLQIVGKDVSVETTGNFTVNSNNNGALHFLADSTGLGCLEVDGKYSQTGTGTVALGVAGGLAYWTPDVANAEYTLLNAAEENDSFVISNSSLWKNTENNRTVQLDDANALSETLSLNQGMLEIGESTIGYLNFTGESGYFNVQLHLSGLDDLAATEALASWMASENEAGNPQALGTGVIGLSSLASADGQGILAWDWSLYNAAYSKDVSLVGLAGQNVPEPATWGMLLLGIGLLICQRRKAVSR